MERLIILNDTDTRGKLPKYRVNVDHISCYYENDKGTTYVCLSNGGHIECVETPEQIDDIFRKVNGNG